MKNIFQNALDIVLDNPPQPAIRKIIPPVVNKKKCTGCGLCVEDCGCKAIKIKDGKADIQVAGEILDCVECGHCLAICPVGAIKDPLADVRDNRTFKPDDLPSSASLRLLFHSRRSVRSYKDKPIPREIFERIIDAARFAPAGGNKPTDIHYLVINSPDQVSALRGPVLESIIRLFKKLDKKSMQIVLGLVLGKENVETVVNYIPVLEYIRYLYDMNGEDRLFFNAPAIMVVHGKKWSDIIAFGCAIALHQAVLMAETLKIGSCYNGFLMEAINYDSRIKNMVGIPKGHKCYGAMTLGYSKVKYKRLVRRVPSPVTWR